MYYIGLQSCLLPNKEYDQILTIDRMPDEDTPLKNRIKIINPAQLSPYKINNHFRNTCPNTCAFILDDNERRYCNSDMYMKQQDISKLVSLLYQYGYEVESGLSQTLFQGYNGGIREDGNRLLFYVRYVNSNIKN